MRSNKKKKWWNELREERGKDVETERQQLRDPLSLKGQQQEQIEANVGKFCSRWPRMVIVGFCQISYFEKLHRQFYV